MWWAYLAAGILGFVIGGLAVAVLVAPTIGKIESLDSELETLKAAISKKAAPRKVSDY